MTYEQAIYLLKGMRGKAIQSESEALNLAISALSNSQKQSESLIRTSADAVSEADVIYRREAIEAAIKADMENHNGILSEKRARVFEEYIAILPSAQPERKKGEWILHLDDLFPEESTMECNQCHEHQPVNIDDNYCPNCGAEMKNNGDD